MKRDYEYVRLGEKKRLERILLQNMRQQEPELRRLLETVNERSYEDRVYRFYAQSFKLFDLQCVTQLLVDALTTIAPDGRPFCGSLRRSSAEGRAGNSHRKTTRIGWSEPPILTAFFHARYFVEMAAKYAVALTEPPEALPYGWAALLCLYGIR